MSNLNQDCKFSLFHCLCSQCHACTIDRRWTLGYWLQKKKIHSLMKNSGTLAICYFMVDSFLLMFIVICWQNKSALS